MKPIRPALHQLFLESPSTAQGAIRRAWLWFVQLILALIRDIKNETLLLHSSSLVYTTLLSLAPLLALSFSVLKGFGVHNQLEPLLLNLLQPLGGNAHEITQQFLSFVSNMKVGVLGAVGLGILVYTVLSLMHKIVSAIDFTWENRTNKIFGHRITDYVTMLLLGPLLLFSLIGAMTGILETSLAQSLLRYEMISQVFQALQEWLHFALVILMLTFIYWFLPSAKVHWYAAFAGAVVATLLWGLIGEAFTTFIVKSTRYMAIYSAFASIIFFMIWLYLSWLVFLLGSRIAFYLQYPRYLYRHTTHLTTDSSVLTGFLALYWLVHAFYTQDRPLKLSHLRRKLNQSEEMTHKLLQVLVENHYLIRGDGSDPVFVLARSPNQMPLKAIMHLLQGDTNRQKQYEGYPEALRTLMTQIDQAKDTVVAESTLAIFKPSSPARES